MRYDTYIAMDGECCIQCESRWLDPGDIEFNNNFIFQRTKCRECGASWDDVYKLERVINFKPGDKQ